MKFFLTLLRNTINLGDSNTTGVNVELQFMPDTRSPLDSLQSERAEETLDRFRETLSDENKIIFYYSYVHQIHKKLKHQNADNSYSFRNMSTQEIGEMLGMSGAAVRKRRSQIDERFEDFVRQLNAD